MSVKADWFVAPADFADDDPFAESDDPGTVIDLTGDIASLTGQIGDLLKREGRLYDNGVRCAIKQDREDTCCSVCPLSQHTNPDSDLYPLCKLGREQERALTRLAVLRHADN